MDCFKFSFISPNHTSEDVKESKCSNTCNVYFLITSSIQIRFVKHLVWENILRKRLCHGNFVYYLAIFAYKNTLKNIGKTWLQIVKYWTSVRFFFTGPFSKEENKCVYPSKLRVMQWPVQNPVKHLRWSVLVT